MYVYVSVFIATYTCVTRRATQRKAKHITFPPLALVPFQINDELRETSFLCVERTLIPL